MILFLINIVDGQILKLGWQAWAAHFTIYQNQIIYTINNKHIICDKLSVCFLARLPKLWLSESCLNDPIGQHGHRYDAEMLCGAHRANFVLCQEREMSMYK